MVLGARHEKNILTLRSSSLETASPNIKVAPPNTIAVPTANALPTMKKQKNQAY